MILRYFNLLRGLALFGHGFRCAVVVAVWLLFPGFLTGQEPSEPTVEGIVAVVGGNVILKSDIENQYLQIRTQGNIQGTATALKCQILETLLFQKLLLHQSQVDSLTVTDAQVENEMDRRMRYFISQAGTPERLEQHFGKSLSEIKNELKEVIRESMLADQSQQKITSGVTITPSEVRSYFRRLHKDSIPLINAEYEIGMIVKRPLVTEEEKQLTREKLHGFRERIRKGDDFGTLAVLYSEDPGSARQGGELGMFRRGEMRLEFEAAAFKLKPGEVSEVVETEDGFHLIQSIQRRGEYINVRHILLQPKVALTDLTAAKNALDSIAEQIRSGKTTYDEAVVKYSDDPGKNSGGWLINPVSGNSRFESSHLDPKIFFVVDKLRTGEVSAPVLFTERGKQDYRIYYLKSRTDPHRATLDNDYARIQDLALEKKKMETVDRWINERVMNTFISINESYQSCSFQRKWKKN